MYRNEHARGAPVLNTAVAVIEMALWDTRGEFLNQPVFNLLGGKVRSSIPAYANGWFDKTGLSQVSRPANLRIATDERCFSHYQYPQLMEIGRPHE
jgi:L-alanine-DL-glutamate epimerase-like enolase superfamily enzyme